MTNAGTGENDNRAEAPTILVVEDEVLIRLAVSDYLRDCGYRVVETGSGDEAVTILTKTDVRIDVVFTDVSMELAFDFDEITRISVGPGWVRMNKTEQKQVVDLFRRFSVSTYASAFSSYDGEQFEIGGTRVQPDIGTIIKTRLVLKNEAPVDLNYLLRETPAGWKIVDVYLAGTISELARRRAEFASIIRRQGVDGLIALLKRKNEEFAGS